MPDPFKIEFQARARPFPVPDRVEVEIDGLETKWVPLSALPRETLAAMVEQWRAKVMGAETPQDNFGVGAAAKYGRSRIVGEREFKANGIRLRCINGASVVVSGIYRPAIDERLRGSIEGFPGAVVRGANDDELLAAAYAWIAETWRIYAHKSNWRTPNDGVGDKLRRSFEEVKDEAPPSDPDLIRVGEDGDPIRVEFRREGGKWVYRCLHIDEALRGWGVIHANVFSASHPFVYPDGCVCLHGRTRSRDAETCEGFGIDPHALAAAVREAMPAARRMVEEAAFSFGDCPGKNTAPPAERVAMRGGGWRPTWGARALFPARRDDGTSTTPGTARLRSPVAEDSIIPHQ